MFYQRELDFIKQVFAKSHLKVFLLNEDEGRMKKEKNDAFLDSRSFFIKKLNLIQDNRLYKYADNFELNYRFLSLPSTPTKQVLLIGPFLRETISEQQALTIGEENEVPPQQQKFLLEFYSSLPVLSDNSPLLTMLNTFCETIWASPSFIVTDFTKEAIVSDTPYSKTLINSESSKALITKEAIERRYAFENDLIRAVSLGQIHIESQFSSAFSSELFEKRVQN
jgi:hypothetical protein